MNKQYVAGRYAFKTDIGRVRMANEDRAVALTNEKGNILLLVCDGMGGSNKGDYASSLASKLISDSFIAKGHFFSTATALHWAHKITREANNLIYKESCESPLYNGMGTTLSMALIIHNFVILIQIGDSRIYFVKDNKLNQISEDQTYVAYLYRTGQIKKEEMLTHPKRHVLMNALGIYPSCNLDLKIYPYKKESILLCSDGLYNNVDENMIEAIMVSDDSPDQKVTKLIALANANGGSDNIATIVWEAK